MARLANVEAAAQHYTIEEGWRVAKALLRTDGAAAAAWHQVLENRPVLVAWGAPRTDGAADAAWHQVLENGP